MVEVYKNLFVGSGEDFASVGHLSSWGFVQAAKEPWHRQALGYDERGIALTHREYLIAKRGNRMILNMVDAPSPDFFRTVFFYESCDFIGELLYNDTLKVLVHCNRGESRAPSIALVYLAFRVGALPTESFVSAANAFLELYPNYAPGRGIQEFLQKNWDSGLFN
jgi:hypothetical protein